MRRLTLIICFTLALSLCTSSSLTPAPGGRAAEPVSLPKRPGEREAGQEADLAAYAAELWLLAEQAGQIRREEAQKLHNDLAALQKEFQAKAEQRQRELAGEVLGVQLELFFVSLSPEEEESKLAQLAALQEELQAVQEELEGEYQARAAELQAEHEELARRRIAALEAQLAGSVQEELESYTRRLSRALANGSY